LKTNEPNDKRTTLLVFLVSFALFAIFFHPLVYFKKDPASFPIILFYLIWLAFRIVYPRMPDPRGIVRGILVGLEVFLLIFFALNARFLFYLDHQTFVASLYFSAGLFFLLDRFRRIFSVLQERWPLSVLAFGMAAILFFGSFSSVVLVRASGDENKTEGLQALQRHVSVPEVIVRAKAPAGEIRISAMKGIL